MGNVEFKHITVTPAEEEDEVIRAGLASAPEDAALDVPVGPEGGEASEGVAPVSQAAPDRGDAPEETSVPPADEPVKKAETDKSAIERNRAKKADSYHETTLDDLKPEPMPMTQKIVIIAAVVCIIGALVFYFAFMR